MSASSAKQRALEAIEKLPADATVEMPSSGWFSSRRLNEGLRSSTPERGFPTPKSSNRSFSDPPVLVAAGR